MKVKLLIPSVYCKSVIQIYCTHIHLQVTEQVFSFVTIVLECKGQ